MEFNDDVFEKLYNNKVNGEILTEFFENEVIQKLWWESNEYPYENGYMNSETVKEILKD